MTTVPGRGDPVATAGGVSLPAGECGAEDQVSRPGPSEPMVGLPAGPVHLALVGATATGKTSLAVALARRRGDLELVSADAIAVYRGLDVGAAKPTPSERAGLAWHLLDLVEPGEEFSVAAFQQAARAALAAIEGRGHRAVLVGGSGLYHRAVVDELALPGRYPETAAALETEAAEPGGPERLHRRLAELDPLAAARIEPGNARRTVRALEVVLGSGRAFSEHGPGLEHYGASRFLQVGLRVPRGELAGRIVARLDAQLASGFIDEVRAWRDAGAVSRTAARALGYAELTAVLDGSVSLEEARRRLVGRTRSFARRQEAWFRRDPRVHWLDADGDDRLGALEALLAACRFPPPPVGTQASGDDVGG